MEQKTKLIIIPTEIEMRGVSYVACEQVEEVLGALQRVRKLAEYIGSLPDIESQNIALAIEKALDGEQ